jgi:hypothetical protein
MTKAVTRAPAETPAADAATPAGFYAAAQELTALIGSKPWTKSLTVQGAAVAALSGLVSAYGPSLLAGVGIAPDNAAELARSAAGVLASVGGLMALIGRLRLGGLH